MTAAEPRTADPREPVEDTGGVAQQRPLIALVVSLFFAWGFSTVLVDSLVPKLKGLFALSYTEVMLTQFTYFLAYLFFSIPAGLVLSRAGYMRSTALGLVVTVSGCLLFAPAAAIGSYPAFLFALFIIATGITLLQVVANPLIAGLGPDATSSSRLTLAQAFNSLGTTIGPWIGAAFIIGNGVALNTAGLAPAALDRLRRNEAHAVQLPFLAIAAVLVVVAAVFWTYRNARMPPVSPQAASLREVARLLHRPRLMLGTLAIFLYVGAEVSIGSVMTNYLMQPSVLGLPAARAGQHVSFYWGGAMVGRFIGAFVLRRARPGYALAACAVVAGLLATASSLSTGVVAAYALIAVGLFNSIMFPTIFALASEGLGEETPNGSAMLCMAIVGGAIVPLATGAVADARGLAIALFVPVLCYVWVAIYGVLVARGLGAARIAGT
ncbi:MAG TPA: sugar MFS transporter [Rhizomicrobium sp.]|nr:sugar MFS transporter [Rhizomicrobium sp.]